MAIAQERPVDGKRAPPPVKGKAAAPPPVKPSGGTAGAGAAAGNRSEKRETGNRSGANARVAAVDRADDRKAIVAQVTEFRRAYNARESRPIAELFAADGLLFDQTAASLSGRDAITAALGERFREEPEAHMEIEVESIRFIGENTAVQQGHIVLVPAPGKRPVHDR
ncbi:MAG: SgcJ/EcaC family oxidoreductase, partial [Planctomycetaceae bacterium]